MRVVIIGLGEVGRELVSQFKDDHQVIAIDARKEAVAPFREVEGVDVIEGSGTSERILRDAEAQAADYVIAVTDNPEVNIVACLLAKSLGERSGGTGPKTVARTQGADYDPGDLQGLRSGFLGIDHTVNPSVLVARELVHFVRDGGRSSVIDLVRGEIELVEVVITADSKHKDAEIEALRLRSKDTLVAAVVRGGQLNVAGGRDVISAGDSLFLVGKPEGLRRAVEMFTGRESRPNVCIAGGGFTAETVARNLLEHKIGIHILESNPERATALGERLEGVRVSIGDATSEADLQEVLEEGTGIFVAVTASDEVNLMSALLAKKKFGVPYTAALNNRAQYLEVLEALEIEKPVSARRAAADVVVREVLAAQGQVLAEVGEKGQAKLREYKVAADRNLVRGKLIREVNFPRGSLVTAILRAKDASGAVEVIIPGGDDRFHVGDTAIVLVAGDDQLEAEVKAIFGRGRS